MLKRTQQGGGPTIDSVEALYWPPRPDEYIQRYEASGRLGKLVMLIFDPAIRKDQKLHRARQEAN